MGPVNFDVVFEKMELGGCGRVSGVQEHRRDSSILETNELIYARTKVKRREEESSHRKNDDNGCRAAPWTFSMVMLAPLSTSD
jgi:hypothetical protein